MQPRVLALAPVPDLYCSYGHWSFDARGQRLRPQPACSCCWRWDALFDGYDYVKSEAGGDNNVQVGMCDGGACGQAAVWETASVLQSTSADGFVSILCYVRSPSCYQD